MIMIYKKYLHLNYLVLIMSKHPSSTASSSFIFLKAAISYASLIIFFTAHASYTLGEEIYDDSASGMLIYANDSILRLDSVAWSGLQITDQGIVYQDTSHNTVLSGADIVVDYTVGSTITPQFVIGGYSNQTSSPVEYNAVTIKRGNVNGSVYGGVSFFDKKEDMSFYDSNYAQVAHYNRVSIADQAGIISENVYGGKAALSLQTVKNSPFSGLGIDNSQLEASSNNVFIGNRNSIMKNIYGGNSYTFLKTSSVSGFSSADTTIYTDNLSLNASFNTVTLDQDIVAKGNVYGGDVALHAITGDIDSPSGAFLYNEIKLNNLSLDTDNNSITIGKDSIVSKNIYGGNLSLLIKSGSATTNSSLYSGSEGITVNGVMLAYSNNVSFDGKLDGGSIYGGNIDFDLDAGSSVANGVVTPGNIDVQGATASAIYNVVTIEKNAHFIGSSSSLYGGYLNDNTGVAPGNYDVFTGNTLNYAAKTPAVLNKVANFENFNFTLIPELKNTETALISAQDIVLGGDVSNTNSSSALSTPSKVAGIGIHSGSVLQADDKFILMQSVNPFTGSGALGQTDYGIAQQGISLLYDVRTDVDIVNKQVTATILGCNTASGESCNTPASRVNPQLKALSEGYLAGSMLVTRGADMVAYDTIDRINQQNQQGFSPFIMTSAQTNRYKSGSYIKSNDELLSGGISYKEDNLIVAAIIEAGWGSYDSYNSFSNAAKVHGDGHNRYYGIGALGRYDFDNGFYTDGSLRYGRTEIKFDTSDLQNKMTGQYATYKLKPQYIGGHAGLGYVYVLDNKSSLDISTKYLWTSIESKNATIAGDKFHFNSVNSSRMRLDGLVNHQYTSNVILKAGVGVEHEFDGKAKGKTHGVYFGSPSVKGTTVIGTIGVVIKPSPASPLSFDVKAQGYVGKREGGGLSLRANYAF